MSDVDDNNDGLHEDESDGERNEDEQDKPLFLQSMQRLRAILPCIH